MTSMLASGEIYSTSFEGGCGRFRGAWRLISRDPRQGASTVHFSTVLYFRVPHLD
jgi:hypothetical protein